MQTMERVALPALDTTPAGRRAAWWLSLLASCAENVRLREVRPYVQPWILQTAGPGPDAPLSALLKMLWVRESFVDSFEILDVDLPVPSVARLTLRGEDGKRWLFNLWVEPKPPHLISWLQYDRAPKEGVVIRPAVPEDAAGLREVERSCPIEVEDGTFTYDRGEDYLAFRRLMDRSTCYLAEYEGRPVGLVGHGLRMGRIGEHVYRLLVALHLRTLPEHRGGLRIALGYSSADEFVEQHDTMVAYVSPGNKTMQEFYANQRNKWAVQALRAVLPCADVAGPPAGRPATASDAPRIVEILNAMHGDEEMYLPYDVSSLTARVERAPDLYRWDRIWISDGAVLGVWPHAFTAIRERDDVRTERRWGLALDYGFVPGAQDEFESLLRARCAALATEGVDDLAIFTSQHASGYELLAGLASDVQRFDMWTPWVPQPDGAWDRGLYVDAVYF